MYGSAEVLDLSVTPGYNLDGMVGTSPKTPTPIRKARSVTSRIWETLSEATILIWQILLAVATLILRRTGSTVTDGFVIFYRVAYLLCENIISLILMPSVKWEGAFVTSCIAASLDPLFFYIPTIDETNKCLGMDKPLITTALILRSLTDIPLTLHFIAQICGRVDTDHPNLSDSDSDHSNSDSDSDFETTSCSLKCVTKRTARWLSVSIVINFLAVLPIPQAAIIVGFFRMRGSSSTEVFLHRTILNVSLVLGYLPRVCQIYLSSQHFRMGGIWIKPSLNLFLYIISGHIFAAFWYFFAIQRVTSCWHQACRNTPGCVATFDCSSTNNTPIIAVLNQLCPINSPNATIFDFGIYLPVLQSGNTGSVQFRTKLFYSLWWGLRNLSNFGTNLETSSYMWENCFAILICISGLLLFLYLIGNMQKYMELPTNKSLESEKKRQAKIRAKKKEIKLWMSNNGISPMSTNGFLRIRIKKYIKRHHIVEKNIKAHVDVTYFLNGNRFAYPIREPLLEYLVQNAVKKVPMLQNMDERGLEILCEHMEPVIYQEKQDIVKEAQLVQMIFIIQGEIECPNSEPLEKGDYHGESIETWVLQNYKRSYYDPLPTSTGHVRCQKKVEAFALDALDLLHFAQQNFIHLNISPEHLEKALAHDNSTHPHAPHQDDQYRLEPWEHPKPGMMKLNCSAVWNPDSKRAGMGWVCRDDRGDFMVAGSHATSPFMDAFLAEASGMATAIQFCLQQRQRGKLKPGIGIVVESDNQDLIDCLNAPPLDSNTNRRISETLRPILDKIFYRATKFKPRSFTHCNRQSNTVANTLANHAVDAPNNGSSSWCDGPPECLKSTLKKDSPDLYIEQDEEMGKNNDFEATSPTDAAHDFEDLYTRMAEESQA